MKVSAHLNGHWFAVPCHGNETVGWLADEVVRRYSKVTSHYLTTDGSAIHLTRGGAELDVDDMLSSVLDDSDVVSVSLVIKNGTQRSDSFTVEQHTVINGALKQNKFSETQIIVIDGSSLTCEELVQLGTGTLQIKLSPDAIERVNESRKLLETILIENKVVYGVNTGFGKFARTVIAKEDLEQLQENLIRSHSAGVGDALSPERARMLLALRINVLAKGYSGISLVVLQQYIDAFNVGCVSWVPEKGTVGASGDLAPLAHLALGLMGEGQMWSPKTGWTEAKQVLEANSLNPIKLGPKERVATTAKFTYFDVKATALTQRCVNVGVTKLLDLHAKKGTGIALINGTQLITALTVEALVRADAAARQADVIAALTLEVLKGTTKAFDTDIHLSRPHKGQTVVAQRFRSLLHSDLFPSEMSDSHRFCNRVQDAYTLRCCPQVHGIVNDTIEFVRQILSVEINSATDNPMVFAERREIISGGNFHGEYPAKAADYLAIGVHELANISERRTERLINPAYSELPAFLTNNGGLNSGFMMAHCTAAALVSENKVLCHPSSVDTLCTSAGTEDHVSMGGFAARKALEVVTNVEYVLAIELLAACQAVEFLRPLTTTAPLEELYKLVRSTVPAWNQDRIMSTDIEAAVLLIKEQKVWKAVEHYMEMYAVKHTADINVTSPTAASCYSQPLSPTPSTKRRRVH